LKLQVIFKRRFEETVTENILSVSSKNKEITEEKEEDYNSV